LLSGFASTFYNAIVGEMGLLEEQAIMARQEQMVILTRKLPDNVETRMRELFNAELNQTDVPLDRGQ